VEGGILNLWEMSLGLLLALVATGLVASGAGETVDAARRGRVLKDMSAILAASRQYEALHGVWPPTLNALREVLPAAPGVNVWGEPYVLQDDGWRLGVETRVPAGAVTGFSGGELGVITPSGGQDKVRLFTGPGRGPADRLVYEKRNTYGP
jgi:hypothetical protein